MTLIKSEPAKFINEVLSFEFDGKLYPTRQLAQRAQAFFTLKELLREDSVGSGGEWSQQMFYNWLTDNYGKLREIFHDIACTEV